MKLINQLIVIIILLLGATACNNEVPNNRLDSSTDETKKDDNSVKNKGYELVYQMTQKVGNHGQLSSKKDVVYT